jgi:hypothetical protein
VLLAAAVFAAACGSSSHPQATARAAAGAIKPLTKWKPTGPMPLELAVNRFDLDAGPLPADPKGHLMPMAKAAVGLCGDCFNAIEALEPALQTRFGGSRCAA